MKYLIVFFVLFVYCSAASVPKYKEITTLRDAQLRSYYSKKYQGPIVGGSLATQNQFPYQVAIALGEDFVVCGGSLISADWVLTACHCTYQHKQYNLRFGSLNYWGGGITMTSFTAIEHPEFNSITLNNDVALIRLPRSIGLGPSIYPISLPRLSQQSQSFEGVLATVSGFGIYSTGPSTSDFLRWVNMRIISNERCAQVYGPEIIKNYVVCGQGYENSYAGHCGGDSGGPLSMNEGNSPVLIGVVSFTYEKGCHEGLPFGYMRTTHFLNWISEHTKITIRP